MTTGTFSDEILMRYADGELDAATVAAVDEALASDDTLAERLGVFMETRAALAKAYGPLLDEPVPAALKDKVRAMVESHRATKTADNVVAFHPAGKKAAGRARWMLPLAASLVAAVIGGAVGYIAADGGSPAGEGIQLAGLNQPGLRHALANVVSGAETPLAGTGTRFRAIATFRDSAGTLCREFELDGSDRSTLIAVACQGDPGWRVTFAVAAPGNDDGYAPASSAEALDAYLGAIEAAPPMSVEEENGALEELRRAME